MKGLLIVGHPYSDYQFIENALYQQGMSRAKSSQRDALAPVDISQQILSIHDVVLEQGSDICQLDAGEVWNGLALDLLLGNKDQPFWGWADPQAIYLLDYWRKIGSRLKFLLVYDTPEAICANLFKGKFITRDGLEQEVNRWQDVYEELLYFYHRNQENCLLVHIDQIRENLSPFIDSTAQLIGYTPSHSDGFAVSASDNNATEVLLVCELLKDFPTIYDSYESLQAAADIPLVTKKIVDKNHTIFAWNSQQKASMLQQEKVVQQEKVIEQYADEVVIFSEKYSELQYEKNELLVKQKKYVAILEKNKIIVGQQQNENKRLLSQLHQLKEESDQHVFAKQATEKKLKQRDKENASLHQQQSVLKALESKYTTLGQEKSKLIANYEKKITEIEKNQANLENDENELLLLQLHQVQEELEHYFIKNQALEKKLTATSKVAVQQTVKKPLYYGAGDRIKRQLSYRLGSIMIQQSRTFSGWITMPMALVREERLFQQNFKKEKLPPISQYQDADEAERVKRHLCYRLGYIMVANTNSVLDWVKLPWLLRREVVDFEKRKLSHI